MNELQEMANKLSVNIIYSSVIEKSGHYLPDLNTIVLNANLTDREVRQVFAHELGHACLHHDEQELYQQTFVIHSKMEYEADCFMIEHLLDEYLSTSDIPINLINYWKFMEAHSLSPCLENLIKERIESKIANNRYAM